MTPPDPAVGAAVLAVDPGSNESAWLVLDGDRPTAFGIEANALVVERLRLMDQPVEVVIETIEPWAGVVGPAALETMYWVGRFQESVHPIPVTLLRRSVVLPKLGVPKLPNGKAQAAARVMLIDRYGGGNPVRRDHPLHGIREDLWSALGLAVAYQDGLRP